MLKIYVDPRTHIDTLIGSVFRPKLLEGLYKHYNVVTVGELFILYNSLGKDDFHLNIRKLRGCGVGAADRITAWMQRHAVGKADEPVVRLTAADYVHKSAQLLIVKELVKDFGKKTTLDDVMRGLEYELNVPKQ